MKILYRQGLVSAQSGFIANGQTPNFIDLIVDTGAVIATIASGSKNYLLSEESTVLNAWGPFLDSNTYYLFWDINPSTGNISRGATSLPLSNSALPPVTPQIGQMWWDTSALNMNVWNGSRWIHVLRVFAGIKNGLGVIPEPFISQVGLNTSADAGYILTDGFGSTFRNQPGDLFTTETNALQNDTGSLVKLDGAAVIVQANESIPAFSLVYLINGRAGLASGIAPTDVSRAPLAMVTEDAYQNSPCSLVMAGKQVFNSQWSFAPSIWGSEVYCDSTGGITLTRPVTAQYVKVGNIVGVSNIYLTFSTIVNDEFNNSNSTIPFQVSNPLSLSMVGNFPVLGIDKSTTSVDGYLSATDFSRIPAIEQQLPNFATLATVWPISQVATLQASLNNKSNIIHSHSESDIVGLSTDLADKAPLVHNQDISSINGLQSQLNVINVSLNTKIPTVPTAIAGNFAIFNNAGSIIDSTINQTVFALADATWPMSSVNGLISSLDLLAPLTTIWNISSINGLQLQLDNIPLKADKVIGAIDGHLAALDVTGNLTDSGYTVLSFANVNATWPISSVVGLQTSLNNLMPIGSVITQSQVTGLSTSLNGKINVGTNFPISQITGLQTSLDNKVNKAGDTMTGTLNVPTLIVGSNTVLIASNGSIIINSTSGVSGQVLTSTGAGPATWTNLPSAITPSAPINEIVFGTGIGISSSTNLSFDSSSNILSVDKINTSSDITIGANLTVTSKISVSGSYGTSGYVLTSQGPSNPATWLPPSAVDTSIFVQKSGSTMTGLLILNADPIDPLGAATKQYVDAVTTTSAPINEIVFGTGSNILSSTNLTFDTVTNIFSVNAININPTGDIVLNGTSGIAGQIITSAGDGAPVMWGDAPQQPSFLGIHNGGEGASFSAVTDLRFIKHNITDLNYGTISIASQDFLINGTDSLANSVTSVYPNDTDVTTSASLTFSTGLVTEITGTNNQDVTVSLVLTTTMITDALTFIPYSNTNPSNYLIAADITSSIITSALGFTPYDNTNPANYLIAADTINAANNLTGGIAGSLPIQTAINTTSMLLPGTAGQILSTTGSGFAWTNTAPQSTFTSNVNGGVAGDMLYQSAASTTVMLSIGTQGQVLTSSGTIPTWSDLIPSVTLTTLPTAIYGGQQCYVTDATGAHVTGSLCFWNPSVANWIDVTTGLTVV